MIEEGNPMKAANLTVDELQAMIRKVVQEELQNIMIDPDRHLEITDEIKARLELSLGSSDRISLQEVKERLKLA